MSFNILVVDDSETARAVIIKTLALAEIPIHEVYQASHGREALDLLEEKWIDLVFADINMPVMSGTEMVEKMWEDGLLRAIPVIIVSSLGSEPLIEQCLAKGVRAYVRKPFTPEQIRSLLVEILGAHHGS